MMEWYMVAMIDGETLVLHVRPVIIHLLLKENFEAVLATGTDCCWDFEVVEVVRCSRCCVPSVSTGRCVHHSVQHSGVILRAKHVLEEVLTSKSLLS